MKIHLDLKYTQIYHKNSMLEIDQIPNIEKILLNLTSENAVELIETIGYVHQKTHQRSQNEYQLIFFDKEHENGVLVDVNKEYMDTVQFKFFIADWKSTIYRDGDKPSILFYRNNKIYQKTWTNKKGKAHRDENLGPAIITYYQNGKVEKEEYVKDNQTHRENGPAFIKYDEEGNIHIEQWWEKGRKKGVELDWGDDQEPPWR